MKRALALCLLLGACATKPAYTPPKVVEIPVSVPCKVQLPEKPAYAADIVSLDEQIFALVQALLIDREQRQEREAKLEAAVKACQ